MKSFNHLVLASILLGATNSVAAQCSSDNTDDTQDQESLCSSFCTVMTQCKTQCLEKPSAQYTDCFCQDVCACAREVCNSCCLASGNSAWCDVYTATDIDYCSTTAGINPADDCYVYANTTYDATEPFPSSIESFLQQIPLPTGITFASGSSDDCDSSPASATATASASDSASSSAATGTGSASSSKSSAGSTDATGTSTNTASQTSSTAKSNSAAGVSTKMTKAAVAMAMFAASAALVLV